MGSKTIQPLLGSPAALAAEVREIEQAIGTDTPVPPGLRNKLFRQLDTLMDRVQRKGSAISEATRYKFEPDLDDLPDKIQKLYGWIHNRSVDTEVSSVVDQAFKLQDRFEHGKDIVADVRRLKKRLEGIQRRHALGEENLSIARVVSRRANQFLQAHALGKSAPPLINQFNLLEVQKIHYRREEMDEELVVGLFEIAENFYHGNYDRETMKRYHLLPEQAKRTLQEHFAHLSISSPKDDRVKAAQALIATAYDLAHGKGTEPYFSPRELEDFFNEASASATT